MPSGVRLFGRPHAVQQGPYHAAVVVALDALADFQHGGPVQSDDQQAFVLQDRIQAPQVVQVEGVCLSVLEAEQKAPNDSPVSV